MCRSIHILYNLDPPVTEEEIHAACLQFVRKISGYDRPSEANEAAYLAAVREVEAASIRLLTTLTTSTPARERRQQTGSRSAEAYQAKSIHQVEV
jgi:hypothetical protein